MHSERQASTPATGRAPVLSHEALVNEKVGAVQAVLFSASWCAVGGRRRDSADADMEPYGEPRRDLRRQRQLQLQRQQY